VDKVTEKVEYYHDLIKYFVNLGYVREKDIRSAPYDWRLAAGKLYSIPLHYSLAYI